MSKRSGSIPPPTGDEPDRDKNFPSRRRLTAKHGDKAGIGFTVDKLAEPRRRGFRYKKVDDMEAIRLRHITDLGDAVFYMNKVIDEPAYADSKRAIWFAGVVHAVAFGLRFGLDQIYADQIDRDQPWPEEFASLNDRINVKRFLSDGVYARECIRDPVIGPVLKETLLQKRRALIATGPVQDHKPAPPENG